MADESLLPILADVVASALKAGADAAEAVAYDGTSLSLTWRDGKVESLERSEGHDLGLRVFIGKRMAITSSSDRSAEALAATVERAVAMARLVPEDPHCGLAGADQLARAPYPSLDLYDPDEPSADALIAMARDAEQAALAVPGVSRPDDGASVGWGRGRTAVVASNGFSGTSDNSRTSLGVSVIAGAGTAMETEYDSTSAVFWRDLEDAGLVGRRAGERAVRRLGARKLDTQRVPVLFDPRVARSLLGHLAGAITGSAIARGTSFLKDKMGQQVLARGLNVIDDPLRARGLRSRPFDGEGLATQRRAVVEDGVLTTWLLDLRSARQLGLQSTGHAARSVSAPPYPTSSNFYLEPGSQSPAEMMAEIGTGLYVTSLMGQGVNLITGDYSRGAAGFWIEGGEIAYPVNEVTIASTLPEMLLNLTPANDLQFRAGTDSPTLRVDGMTLAGR
jgi:PmbA protein